MNQEQKEKSPPTMDAPPAKRPKESPLKARLKSRFWKKPKPMADISTTNVTQIKNISLNQSTNQSIVFRVSLVGRLKKCANDGEDCYRFHGFDNTGEIAFFAFNRAQEIADKIKLNAVYKLENYGVRHEDPAFPQYTGIGFQVIIGKNSVLSDFKINAISQIPFKFASIRSITESEIAIGTRVDLFGVIAEDWGVEKTSKGVAKRDLRITDETKEEMIITLWDDLAETLKYSPGSSIAIRKAFVKEFFDTRCLSAARCTLLWVKPELPGNRAEEIETWFEAEREKFNA